MNKENKKISEVMSILAKRRHEKRRKTGELKKDIEKMNKARLKKMKQNKVTNIPPL